MPLQVIQLDVDSEIAAKIVHELPNALYIIVPEVGEEQRWFLWLLQYFLE